MPLKFNVKEYEFPIVSGLINSRELFAKALKIKSKQIIPHLTNKLKNLIDYTYVNNAPFKENEFKLNKNGDLSKFLPVIDFYGGRKYTTSSIVIVKYPNEERFNASFHRMMFLGNNKFAIRIVPQRHLDITYNHSIKEGKDLKVAVIFGVHPAIEIASAFSTPALDELKLASSFINGLNVFELENGIIVPANAEFVLEGRILDQLTEEGPFIDLTGTPDIIRKQPILEVDKLYHRKDPIFRTILPGGSEHKMLMGIPQEPRIFKSVSNTIGTIKDVILTPGGSSWLHAVVQIQKRTEGDPKNTILATLAAHPSLKRVIIVDEDIDITSSDDVEWAIATRVQPDKDLVLIPNSKGSSLDPSSNNSITCKWGIDATKPLKNNQEFNRVKF
ncbi:MAG: UbiD family decarboxylase [Candidatus Lokiarchaeota archaeon]